MSRKHFLYYFFNEDKKPLYVDGNAVLQGDATTYTKATGEPAHLEYSPEGWQDTTVKYARNIKYWGLFRDFVSELKFVFDGRKILHDSFWRIGYNVVRYLAIARFDRLRLPYQYNPWYLSELNFVKYKEADKETSIEVLEGGLSKYIKAYEDTMYEIPVDEVVVEDDGMQLDNTATFFIGNGTSDTFGSHVVETIVVSKEVDLIGGAFDTTRTRVNNLNTDIRHTGQYIFKATADGLVHFQWDFEITVDYTAPPAINPAAHMEVVLRAIATDNTSSAPHQITMLARNTNNIPGFYRLQGAADLNMFAGEELYLYTFVSPTGATGDAQTSFTYGGSEPFLKMVYTYRHPTSNVKSITGHTLLKRLLAKLTGDKYKIVISALLQQKLDTLVLTCGDALRGLDGAMIKTSLASFFKSYNARFSVGLGVQGDTLLFDTLPVFFKQQVVLNLGKVKKAELFVAEDLLFNTIKNGYKPQEYKEINGKMEFNQGQTWTTSVTKLTKELDLVSEYRADPFGAELLRINYSKKTTTDTSSDNDTFFLAVKKKSNYAFTGKVSFVVFTQFIVLFGAAGDLAHFTPGTSIRFTNSLLNDHAFTVKSVGVNGADLIIQPNEHIIDESIPSSTTSIATYILSRPAYTNVTGLLHPESTFNIELSPKRGLLENGAFIRSVLHPMDADTIVNQTSDKNGDLSTTLNGITIKENETIQIGNLPDRLFLPYYITFTTEVDINFIELVDGNPYGLVQFEWNDRQWFAFLMDGGMKPVTNEMQNWKVLAAPNNNFKLFNNE